MSLPQEILPVLDPLLQHSESPGVAEIGINVRELLHPVFAHFRELKRSVYSPPMQGSVRQSDVTVEITGIDLNPSRRSFSKN